MADAQKPEENKKPAWLQEVEDDATRIQQRRFREQEEERQYQLQKRAEADKRSNNPDVNQNPQVTAQQAGGEFYEPSVKKGK